MKICLECGKVFEDDKIARWKESRGECAGEIAYEEVCGCPYCRGEVEDVIKCKNCGEYFPKRMQMRFDTWFSDISDLDDALCPECEQLADEEE